MGCVFKGKKEYKKPAEAGFRQNQVWGTWSCHDISL